MSSFLIKLFALIIMCSDHVAVILGELDGWGIIDYDMYKVLRGIGRISFPLFAFCLVNGFYKTRNIDCYISRILSFAVISQIPFMLAFYPVNLMLFSETEVLYYFRCNGYILILIVPLLAYWFLFNRQKPTMRYLFWIMAIIMSAISVKANGMWLLYSGGSLNVFYTLALGLEILTGIERFLMPGIKIYEKAAIVICTLLGLYIIGTRSDYGIAGIALIVAFYFSKNNKIKSVMVVCIWGFMFYFIINGNLYNAVFTCISALFISSYNGKKGISAKYLFYSFYPLHLLILGMVNISFRFGLTENIFF